MDSDVAGEQARPQGRGLLDKLTLGTGLPTGIKFTTTTIPNDRSKDTIGGGNGLDWFWSYANDVLVDKLGTETLR